MQLTTITDETRLVIANLGDRATGIVTPTVRLGVTGLARAGKTVFIAALVHNLIHGGRLPLFKSYAAGRVAGARVEPIGCIQIRVPLRPSMATVAPDWLEA